MALRASTALRNYTLKYGSFADALSGGKIEIRSGAQPATADAAPSGTLLATITSNSAAHTAEVLATGTVTITGSSGSVDGITVDGVAIMDNAVTYVTSLDATAALVAAEINNSSSSPEYTASSASGVITIRAMRGVGAAANTFAVVSSVTTLGSTDVNLSGGVTSVNGLKFGVATAGVIVKLATQTWAGDAVATGTAGYYRFIGAVADSGVADTTASQIRLDGAIASSGAEANMSPTSITTSANQSLSTFAITLPTA